MKFQDSSFNGLKVTVGTKKCDPPTHARSKSNMPHQLFQSWGHKHYSVNAVRVQLRHSFSVRYMKAMTIFVQSSELSKRTRPTNYISNTYAMTGNCSNRNPNSAVKTKTANN